MVSPSQHRFESSSDWNSNFWIWVDPEVMKFLYFNPILTSWWCHSFEILFQIFVVISARRTNTSIEMLWHAVTHCYAFFLCHMNPFGLEFCHSCMMETVFYIHCQELRVTSDKLRFSNRKATRYSISVRLLSRVSTVFEIFSHLWCYLFVKFWQKY